MFRIGVISDTHGLLRPQAAAFLQGADHILHGGDIGREEILHALAAIAPLTAIRGNVDTGEWAAAVPETRQVVLAGLRVHLLHDRRNLDIDPDAEDIDIVVSGHSHRPLVEHRDGVLYLNPGSAGPRRFKLPVSVAEVLVDRGSITPRVVELSVDAPKR
ncbi:MAG: metallophosphatase family protein [Pseudomonadota bacterium]|nr:metallophosphatase family protein [Pseudomonadota bacterium]